MLILKATQGNERNNRGRLISQGLAREKEKDETMKLLKLCIPVALLALASINAYALPVTCASLTGQSLTNYQTAGSCVIGDLTFSNFQFQFSSSVSNSSAGIPDPTTGTFISITENTSPIISDPNGTTGSPSDPVYSLITDFSTDGGTTGDAFVQFNQDVNLAVQYQVTVAGGHFVNEIDGAGTGGINSDSTNAVNNFSKDICYGQAFAANTNTHPVTLNGKCANNTFPNSTPVDVDQVMQSADPTQFLNMDTNADGALYNQGVLGSTFGVYDLTHLNGGSNSSSTFIESAAGAQENDFVEAVTITHGTPEPGTFILLGGALVGLGALRRRKKIA